MTDLICQVTLETIQHAYTLVSPIARATPLLSSEACSQRLGQPVYLKLENLQRTGSFKIRGAYYKLSRLAAHQCREVLAISAGNHAQGVALAGRMTGIASTVFMPAEASLAKVQATQSYGAKVICMGASFDEAKSHAMNWLAEHPGVPFISPFDDDDIIAGQGTIGLEIQKQLPDVDTVVVPVGGGGLISGIAIALKALRPQVRIIGVQSKAVPSLFQAFRHQKIVPLTSYLPTIADGIAIKQPAQRNFEIIQRWVDDMLVVDEEEIIQALFFALQHKHIIAEGAGVVGLAALLAGKIQAQGPTLILLSGGNIDIKMLDSIINKGMSRIGRFLTFRTLIADHPGSLKKVIDLIAKFKGNILSIQHARFRNNIPLGATEVEIEVETHDAHHGAEILLALEKKGYITTQL